MYKIVETSQAPVPENTDDNLTRHHLKPMIQQEINDIGKSEKFGSSASKLLVVPPINCNFPKRFLH